MDSYLPKSYPSLMEGKKILYVHGFLSAGSTHTADVLRQFMPRATVLAPDLPVHPAEAMALLKETVESERPDLIIGTSMGGMYTEMLYGFDRICVNPAFEMGATMSEHQMMGKQTFQNPRQDGVQEIIVTKALVKEYREMTEHCFSQVTAEEQQRVFGLFGDEDPIVRWIDDRQTGRNRPTVLIHWDTLADAYGQPKSSLHKAYEQLLEHYNVHFVVPAPTCHPDQLASQQAWIERVFSAPAWNRVIFANNLQLLYGDYLISSSETPDFIGTSLRFGSDELKTWEDIIVFFDRLGGQ